jgi:hypothetical protein
VIMAAITAAATMAAIVFNMTAPLFRLCAGAFRSRQHQSRKSPHPSL